MRTTDPHLLCLKCAVHIFISLYSQLLIRLRRFFRITPLYLRKRSKTELYHLFRSQSSKRFRGSAAHEGITRKPNFVPTLPAFVLNLGPPGTKQNLKMAASGHGCIFLHFHRVSRFVVIIYMIF